MLSRQSLCKYSKIWKTPKSETLLVPSVSDNDTQPDSQLPWQESQSDIYLNWIDKLSFNLHDASSSQAVWTETESQFRFSLYGDLLQLKLNGCVIQDVKSWEREREWQAVNMNIYLVIDDEQPMSYSETRRAEWPVTWGLWVQTSKTVLKPKLTASRDIRKIYKGKKK
jgi:hypothetical protein